jgi:hypothetical protein
MKITTLPLKHSMYGSPFRVRSICIVCTLACLALSQRAEAECSQFCDGNSNTAFGVSQVNGVENTVVGRQGLLLNQTGGQNTVVGALAGLGITGNGNTAIGDKAIANSLGGNDNTALGYAALSYCSGDNNIGIGVVGGTKLTTGSHNIDIGNQGEANDSRTIRIGNIRTQTQTMIAGIHDVTVPDGVGVVINKNGRLGTVSSSARYKEAIKPMDNASEAILSLQPVTFRYKHELDPAGIPQFGLVAEEVEKVNPALVARDEQGKAYTVRYEAVNAMLLNEVLKEHRAFVEEQHKVERLESEVIKLIATVKGQAAQIQKGSAQVEMSKPVLQTIANNQ